MLKGIPATLGPDVLWALAAMGHGDRLAVVDANYPAHALHARVLPVALTSLPQAVDDLLQVFPLDHEDEPLLRMVPDADPGFEAPVHAAVRGVVCRREGRDVAAGPLGRHDFYDRARGAFAVVLTSATDSYGCFLLTKGVVTS